MPTSILNRFPNQETFVQEIQKGNRRLLSKAITLIESQRSELSTLGQNIVEELLPTTGNSLRIGISGVPGVGKSTFLEALGLELVEQGLKVAILAVDPSSSTTGGSILGDKTRMTLLSRHPLAFIRPSPTSGTLGGVAQKTREALLLCEASGFDVIFVETVGVGQSETVVSKMTDVFLVLMLPGAGDELQGIKRGLMEVADILAIHKADGNYLSKAKLAKQTYENALQVMQSKYNNWKTPVVMCSSLEKKGLTELWNLVQNFVESNRIHGWFEKKRQQQQIQWMWDLVTETWMQTLKQNPELKTKVKMLEKQVMQNQTSPQKACNELLSHLFHNSFTKKEGSEHHKV